MASCHLQIKAPPMLRTVLFFGLMLASVVSSTSHATPAPASAQACAACHGAQGQGGGIFPRIAGQPVEFLQNELRFFRSGARPNPMMQPVTKNLSDADIAALAGYFSTDRKSTRLNSSHHSISYAVFCL